MTDAEGAPGVEERLARELDPDRHRKPSEGVPQELPGDGGLDDRPDAGPDDGPDAGPTPR